MAGRRLSLAPPLVPRPRVTAFLWALLWTCGAAARPRDWEEGALFWPLLWPGLAAET